MVKDVRGKGPTSIIVNEKKDTIEIFYTRIKSPLESFILNNFPDPIENLLDIYKNILFAQEKKLSEEIYRKLSIKIKIFDYEMNIIEDKYLLILKKF